jgi:hypothetical protein
MLGDVESSSLGVELPNSFLLLMMQSNIIEEQTCPLLMTLTAKASWRAGPVGEPLLSISYCNSYGNDLNFVWYYQIN